VWGGGEGGPQRGGTGDLIFFFFNIFFGGRGKGVLFKWGVVGGGGGVGLFQIFQRVILKYLLHKTQTLFTLAYILNTPTGDEMGG